MHFTISVGLPHRIGNYELVNCNCETNFLFWNLSRVFSTFSRLPSGSGLIENFRLTGTFADKKTFGYHCQLVFGSPISDVIIKNADLMLFQTTTDRVIQLQQQNNLFVGLLGKTNRSVGLRALILITLR